MRRSIIFAVLLFVVAIYLVNHNNRNNDNIQSSKQRTQERMQQGRQNRVHKVIVIGSGLAASTAANEALKAGSIVEMIEKDSQFGGNSMKASSGINAALNEEDFEAFTEDTLKSSEGLADPIILKTFIEQSMGNVKYLEEELGVSLNQVVKLGGHSRPRTFRNPVNDSTNIGYLLISKFKEKLLAHSNFTLLLNTQVTHLLRNNEGAVTGVEVKASKEGERMGEGEERREAEAVVVATGGFAQNKELISGLAPDLLPFPSTNKLGTLGEGIQLCKEMGAKAVQMEYIQLHPTGFIDPADPSSKVKILAPEALRGYGAVLLNHTGDRFVNELGLRKHLSAAISQHCADHVAWLLLTPQMLDNFGSSLSFYLKKQIIRRYETVGEAAKQMKIEEGKLRETLAQYNADCQAGHPDRFGKSTFPAQFDLEGAIYLSQVTPSIHYTMGGIAYNHLAQALNEEGVPIPGLYVAGETSGGLHGANRLGGNSLAECVVFGRLAGRNAASFSP